MDTIEEVRAYMDQNKEKLEGFCETLTGVMVQAVPAIGQREGIPEPAWLLLFLSTLARTSAMTGMQLGMDKTAFVTAMSQSFDVAQAEMHEAEVEELTGRDSSG